MKKAIVVVAIIGFLTFGFANQALAGFSISVGTDDFYLSVGDYDYFPYVYRHSYYRSSPRISFYTVLSDYGFWVSVTPFGQVWRPYAYSGWRPYVYGHWIYTSYGLTWEGYEPWAWVPYHYGHWIWTERFGWVWVPGYKWHPANVLWSYGYDSIGWMPAPPPGYDYCRGYLHYHGSINQFSYYDHGPDFDDYYDDYDRDRYYDSGYENPYFDSRYRDLYYNSGYRNISINLWVFINNNHFHYDNYSAYYLDRDYTRNLFDHRALRISSRPLNRIQIERIVKHKIQEVPVEVKEIQIDRRAIKMVIPAGREEKIKKHANQTVKEVIAPAFVEKQKTFKGFNTPHQHVVSKVFKQEQRSPRVEKLESRDLLDKAIITHQQKEKTREQILKKELEQMHRHWEEKEKERKYKEKETDDSHREQPQIPRYQKPRESQHYRSEPRDRQPEEHEKQQIDQSFHETQKYEKQTEVEEEQQKKIKRQDLEKEKKQDHKEKSKQNKKDRDKDRDKEFDGDKHH